MSKDNKDQKNAGYYGEKDDQLSKRPAKYNGRKNFRPDKSDKETDKITIERTKIKEKYLTKRDNKNHTKNYHNQRRKSEPHNLYRPNIVSPTKSIQNTNSHSDLDLELDFSSDEKLSDIEPESGDENEYDVDLPGTLTSASISPDKESKLKEDLTRMRH